MPGRLAESPVCARPVGSSGRRGHPWRRARRTAERRRTRPRSPVPTARTPDADAPRTESPSRRNTVPASKMATSATPRAWLRATACTSPGMRRVRRKESSACRGFATGTAWACPVIARSSADAKVSSRTSRRPARTSASLARERKRYAAGTPPACPVGGTLAPMRSYPRSLATSSIRSTSRSMSTRKPGTSTSTRSTPSSCVARWAIARRSKAPSVSARLISYPTSDEARAGRIATHRRGGTSPSAAMPRDTVPPAHAAMSCAPLAAPSSRASGSEPRSNRCEASVCRSSRRAVRRMPVRVNDADSSSTSVVSSPTSEVGTAHHAGDRDRALEVADQQVPLGHHAVDPIERSERFPFVRAAHDDARPLEPMQVEGVERLPQLEHRVVRGVDDRRDRSHARRREPGLRTDRRGPSADAADHPCHVPRTPVGGVDLDRGHVARRARRTPAGPAAGRARECR